MSLIYCYGIIEEQNSIHISGFNDITLLEYKDIFAVISSVEEDEFSQELINKNVRNMSWLTTNAPIHEAIVDAFNQTTTIIPMKFCTVFNTKESLLAMLKTQYAHFKTNLEYLRGKGEMSVKVYSDNIHAKKEILQSNPEVLQEMKIAKELSPGKSYFTLKKIDEKIEELLQAAITKECSLIESTVEKYSLEMKKKAVVEQKGSHMLINIACIIDKKEKNNFQIKISQTNAKLVNLIVSGPFAAYNFIH